MHSSKISTWIWWTFFLVVLLLAVVFFSLAVGAVLLSPLKGAG